MEFVILTGLSGAGKTRAMHAMEDIGFFCVDNLPPALIPVFYDLCLKTEGTQNRAAVEMCIRDSNQLNHYSTASRKNQEVFFKFEKIFSGAAGENQPFLFFRESYIIKLAKCFDESLRFWAKEYF